MPYLIRYLTKKAGERFEQFFQQAQNQKFQKEEEGSVSINKMPPRSKGSRKKVGEYVDYEELD